MSLLRYCLNRDGTGYVFLFGLSSFTKVPCGGGSPHP